MKKWGVKFPQCTKKIKRVKASQIRFTTVARLKCFNCGSFKRKKSCPPLVKPVEFYKKKFESARKIYMVIMETDGSIPWRDGLPDSMLNKKVDRGLKGAARGMAASLHKTLIKVRKRKKCWVLISGSCSACRVCNVFGKCKKKMLALSPESCGIDVINTLRDLDFEIKDVPYDSVVNVGFVIFK